jgi:alginate O-acetyltransferase complex protein AlgI
MIFTEARFFVFFGIAFFVYWALKPNAARKIWLLGCSIVFYAAWNWRFLGLVLVTIVQTYIATLLLARTDRSAPRRAILATSASLALLTLGYFKYYNFFIDSLSAIIPLGAFAKSIILPVGISFYTFHALSYLIDTYRRKIDPTKNIIDVSLYVLFFPQLVAGPIVRATDLLPQMQHARSFEVASARYFIGIFLIGYFKKAVISDGLAPLVDVFFANPGGFGAGDMLTAVFFYTVQIYCDFSGYTDMAIAIAACWDID